MLRRPHRVAPLVASLDRGTPEPHRALFIADPDDASEISAIREAGGELITLAGGYAAKINAGIRATSEPLLFLGADDLAFHPGWLPAAAALLSDTVGVVGTNDLGNSRVVAGEHATHSLVSRWYAELGQVDGAPGLLHEGYRHNFVDDELVATARHRGAFAFAADSHVEHLHPDWGKGARDEVYARGRAGFERDRRHFRSRRRLWTSRSSSAPSATRAGSTSPAHARSPRPRTRPR